MTADALLPKSLSPAALAAGLVCLAALGAIVTALAFEHIGGYAPCPLCLQQRIAYYVAIPAGLVAFLLARGEALFDLPGGERSAFLKNLGDLLDAGLKPQ